MWIIVPQAEGTKFGCAASCPGLEDEGAADREMFFTQDFEG